MVQAMRYEDHITAVDREASALVEALAVMPGDAPVPTCPDWTLADLARHVGEVTGLWTHLLCEAAGRPKPPFGEPPDGSGVAGWYADVAGHLVSELRATPPDMEVWSWMPAGGTARFVARRAAHEVAVHRVDAELVGGAAGPIEPGLAADGIEEIFAIIEGEGPPHGTGGGETLHLHGTDRDHEWTLTLGPEGLAVDRRHAKGDLALRASVSDLELVLYQRPPAGPVEVFGDDAVLDAWRRAFTFT